LSFQIKPFKERNIYVRTIKIRTITSGSICIIFFGLLAILW
jgi:hypothetical protein